MVNRTVVVGLGLVLLSGCSSAGDGAADPSARPPSASASAGQAGSNGTVYSSVMDTTAGTVTITSHALNADGSVGGSTELLTGEATDTGFPAVVDGIGPTTLTGSFTDFWTTDLQTRAAGAVTGEVPAPQWCGGEGLLSNQCTLLDGAHVARTTDLGRDPETDEGPSEGSILVSSLSDGSTVDEFGPIADLTKMFGMASADSVLIVTTPAQAADSPGATSTVLRMDLTNGTTAELGTSPAGWVALCPMGADSVLGYTDDQAPTAAVVGPAKVAAVTWDDQDSIVGCSADGLFLYVQRIPQPPTEETEDTEPPNPSTALERISLADGSRTEVLTLAPGEIAGPVTR
jgi:hypothetical protein